MSKSRLSALLRSALESQRPEEAAVDAVTPADAAAETAAEAPVVEETPAAPVEDAAPAAEPEATETPAVESADEPAAVEPEAAPAEAEPATSEEAPTADAAPEPEAAPAAVVEATDVVAVESAEEEIIAVEQIEVVSQEGIKGALKGFLLGTVANVTGGAIAGATANPIVGGVARIGASATVDRAFKIKREQLKQDINTIAKRIADVRNGDLAEAKKKGIDIKESDRKEVDVKDVLKAALIGNVLPFYTTYQGHKAEQLEVELAAKIAELKFEFAKNGIAVESMEEPAAEVAAEETPTVAIDENGEVPAEELPTAKEGDVEAAVAEVDAAPVEAAAVVALEEGAEVIEAAPAAEEVVAPASLDDLPPAEAAPVQEAADAVIQAVDAAANGESVPEPDAGPDAEPVAAVLDSADSAAIQAEEIVLDATPAEDAVPAAEVVVEAPATEDATPELDAAPVEIAEVTEAAPAAEEPTAEPVVEAEPAAEVAPVETAADAEAEADVAAAIEEVVPADASNLETSLVEVQGAEREVDESTDQVEELGEIVNGLESIAASLEASVQSGGLQPQAAQFLNLAVGSYTARLGIEQAVTPGMESFGGHTSRISATQISLEGVQELAKKVWEGIKKVLAALRTAIAAFLSKVAMGAGQLRTRAENLLEKAATASGAAKAKEIELGSLADKLSINGKINGNNLAQSLKQVADLTASALEYDDAAQSILDSHAKNLRAMAVADDKTFNLRAKVAAETPLPFPRAFDQKLEAPAGVVRHSTKVMPGNRTFYVQINDDRISVGSVMKDAATTVDKLKVLSVSEIEAIAKVAIEIADLAEKAKDAAEAADKAIDRDLADVKANDDLSAENGRVVLAEMRKFQRRTAAHGQVSAKVSAYAIGTARAYLALAEKSVAQYNTEAAEAVAA